MNHADAYFASNTYFQIEIIINVDIVLRTERVTGCSGQVMATAQGMSTRVFSQIKMTFSYFSIHSSTYNEIFQNILNDYGESSTK